MAISRSGCLLPRSKCQLLLSKISKNNELAISIRYFFTGEGLGVASRKEKKSKIKKVVEDAIIPLERNHEKWSNFLFPPYQSGSNIDFYAVRSSKGIIEDDKLGGWIEVTPATGLTIPTHKTYSVYVALNTLWQQSGGQSNQVISTTLSKIARCMGIDRPSGKNLEEILEEMKVMSRTTFTWRNSYETVDGDSHTGEDWTMFNVYRWNWLDEGVADHERFSGSVVEFSFSEYLSNNVLNKVTIPVNRREGRKLRTGLATMYYSRLDTILFKKRKHENTAKTIIQEFSLDPLKHRSLSKRERLCVGLARQLDGRETSVLGVFIRAEAMLTADGTDWKVRFSKTDNKSKGKDKSKQRDNVSPLPVVNDEFEQADLADMMATMLEISASNKTLVRFSRVYSRDLINAACSEYKLASRGGSKPIKTPIAFFSAIVHQRCHVMGRRWVAGCDKDCPFRMENQLAFSAVD